MRCHQIFKFKPIFACMFSPVFSSNNGFHESPDMSQIRRFFSTPQEREDAELAENYAKEEEEAVEGESEVHQFIPHGQTLQRKLKGILTTPPPKEKLPLPTARV